ncbi:SCN11A [Symbiodinium natans]|uniref:SCN11A protein n=1 Tax=Symbiodinium natans TaxID=878477 RepID=A0A812M691_9DINO|nr:SCN11A [Symbiodinium natans]
MAAPSEADPARDDTPAALLSPDVTLLLRTMRSQHEQLIERLDEQERILKLEASGTPSPTRPLRAGGTFGSGTSSWASKSPLQAGERPPTGHSESAEQLDTLDSDLSTTQQLKSGLRSYTAEDLSLKLGAELAEASTQRRRFSQREKHMSNNAPRSLWRVGWTPTSIKVVNSPGFDVFFALVVTVNAVYIGFDVQRSLMNTGPRPLEYQILQYFFTTVFTIELVTRVVASRCRYFVSEDWIWALLDVVIVGTSLWEVLVDVLAGAVDLNTINGLSSLKAFRVIRLTRLLKMVQFLRIFRFVMALRTLVQSIMHTLKALFWALLLLVLIVYVFAVLFAQGVNDYVSGNPDLADSDMVLSGMKYFGGLDVSMLSLFMSIAGGVSWEQVIEPLREISTVWSLCYIFYICFTYFAVLNVVTAVFCQSAIESAQKDHATVVQNMIDDKESHLAKLRTLFSKLGADATGGITLRMFEEKIDTPSVREYFETLGLDIWDTWSFFKLLDANLGGVVDLEEFFMGCLRFSGTASALDLGKLSQDQAWLIKNQGRFQRFVEKELVLLREEMSTLSEFISSMSRGVACAQV